jgi:hypothetical protein
MPAVNGVGEAGAGEPHARCADLTRSTGVAQLPGKPAAMKAPGSTVSEPPRQPPTLYRGRWLALGLRPRRLLVPTLAFGYDGGSARGPGSRGCHEPRGFSFLASLHAAVIAAAQGQEAWIFSCRFRPDPGQPRRVTHEPGDDLVRLCHRARSVRYRERDTRRRAPCGLERTPASP